MDEKEARLILQSYRPNDADRDDASFAEALSATETNRNLAAWFTEEQEFDRAIAAHLAAIAAPFGLKARLLANAAAPAQSSARLRWAFGLVSLVATILLVTQFVSLRRSHDSTAALMPDYAREMVSFVQLPPRLEISSGQLDEIDRWLVRRGSNATPHIPRRLAALEPVGCRVLAFRDRDVTLICFRRSDNRLAHLFVVDRAAFPRLEAGQPKFSKEGEWATAAWVEDGKVYLIAVQGDEATAKQFLPHA